MSRLSRWRRLSASLILLISSTLISALVFELALRFTTRAEKYQRKFFPDGYFVPDQTLGAAIAANYPATWFSFKGPGHPVFSNELQCFDRPFDRQQEHYILFIGDSWTWGYTSLEEKWTTLLHERLGIGGLKCGVPGTGTRYQNILLKSLLRRVPRMPDIVIQLYSRNDFNDDFVFPAYTVVQEQRASNFRHVDLNTCKKALSTQRALSMRMRHVKKDRRTWLQKNSIHLQPR